MAARRASRIEPDKLDRIIELRLRGVPVRQVAEQVDVAPSTVQRAWNRWLDDTAAERADALERTRAELIARQLRIAREARERFDAAVADATAAEDEKARAMLHRAAVGALAEERQALREVERITGAAAATRVEHSGAVAHTVDLSRLSEDELVALIEASGDTPS